MIPKGTLDELVACKLQASDYTKSLAEAIKAQAEKHQVDPKALRKAVTAMAADKREEAREEADAVSAILASLVA